MNYNFIEIKNVYNSSFFFFCCFVNFCLTSLSLSASLISRSTASESMSSLSPILDFTQFQPSTAVYAVKIPVALSIKPPSAHHEHQEQYLQYVQ